MGKNVFERHFDGDDQKIEILAPLIDPGGIVSRDPNLSIMLNSFPWMSLSIFSTVSQKVDKINALLTCLRPVHFCGMVAGFLSCPRIFYRFVVAQWLGTCLWC